MTKPVLIVAAIALVGTVAWLFLMPPTADAPTTDEVDGDSNAPTEMTEQSSEEATDTFAGTAALATLLERGGSFICTFRSEENGVVSEGDFYSDSERFRVSAMTNVDGEMVASDMINNGATTYIWSDTPDGRVGFMMANETMDGMAGGDAPYPGESSQFDVNETVDYECEGWLVNESFFTPPSDVEFTDMEQMMQGMMEGFEIPTMQ